MTDFDELRDSLRTDQKSGVPFWIPVVIVIVIGVLGGLLSSAIAPKPQPLLPHISANLEKPKIDTVPASTGLPEPDVAEASGLLNDETIKHMAKYSKDELFAERAKMMERYNKTIGQADSCGGMGRDRQIQQIIANYQSKNEKNYQAWVDGRNISEFETKMKTGQVTKNDAMKAALTGELRRTAANSMMEDMAMMSGMMAPALTDNQCSKLKADIQMGVYNIPAPPSN